MSKYEKRVLMSVIVTLVIVFANTGFALYRHNQMPKEVKKSVESYFQAHKAELKGDKGIQGIPGETGAVGAAGAAGRTGAVGASGATGSAGATGQAGMNGCTWVDGYGWYCP